MPTISLIAHKIGPPPNNEPQIGGGSSDMASDIDAVGQLLYTRLLLFLGEWWADKSDGTAMWQKILGVGGGSNISTASLTLQQRIRSTPGVVDITNLQTNFNHSTRLFTFYAVVKTQFGNLVITNQSQQPPSGALPAGS